MIVAIEGIDASGKNTQVKRLHDWFTTAYTFDGLRFGDVKCHDFPHYETTAGGVVGRVLRGETLIATRDQLMNCHDDDITVMGNDVAKEWSRDKAIIIQSVMIADRLEWMPLLVQYAQSPDNLLLLDRYKLSGVAYGAADGIEANWIRTVQSCIPDADLNVLLDISVYESKRRRPERRDYYEKQFDKLHLARGYYLREYSQLSASDIDSCLVVNGEQDTKLITEQIVGAIAHRIATLLRDQELTVEVEK